MSHSTPPPMSARMLSIGWTLILLSTDCGCASDPVLEGDSGPYDEEESSGCDLDGGDAAHPFGNHEFAYHPGTILPDEWSAKERDDAVRAAYGRWVKAYLRDECESDAFYIEIGQAESLTVSEAHGYGMIVLAYMAGHEPLARDYFDGMMRYFKAHPSDCAGGLMAWSQDSSCENNLGGCSATDGDYDIAYALLLADKQWGSGGVWDYHREALRILGRIKQNEVDRTNSYALLGDWTDFNEPYYYDATRSSDFMPGHLASFAVVTADADWHHIADRTYEVFDYLQDRYAPTTGLVPDFIQHPLSSPVPAEADFLERPYDGEYSWNACRVPMRVGIHYLTSGDTRARSVVSRLDTWIQSAAEQDPMNISAGYWLDGDSLPGSQYESFAFVAPFGVAAMNSSGSRSWLNRIWRRLATSSEPTGYYGDTLKLLSMIAMSGNWWAPETAPCESG